MVGSGRAKIHKKKSPPGRLEGQRYAGHPFHQESEPLHAVKIRDDFKTD